MGSIPTGTGIWWPGTTASIPSGWTRNTNLDDRYGKGTAAGVNPNVTGGASTHTHSSSGHTHPVGSHSHTYTLPNVSSYGSVSGNTHYGHPQKLHTHSGGSSGAIGGTSGSTGPSWASSSSDPAYYTMIHLESDGTPAGFPDDGFIYYNVASAPSGWTQHAGSVSKYVKGPAAGAGGGGTGGGSHTHSPSSSHTHTGSSHTHGTGTSGTQSAGGDYDYPNDPEGAGAKSASNTHTHVWTPAAGTSAAASATTGGATGSTTFKPAFYTLLGIQNTSGGDDWLENGIGTWLGTLASIDADWKLCDGTASTPDLRSKFILNAASGGGDLGGTGADVGHTHSAPSSHTHSASNHTHTVPTSSATANATNEHTTDNGNDGPASQNHTHASGTTAAAGPTYSAGTQAISSTADTQPAFRTFAYIMAPSEPSSGNSLMFGSNF